MNNSKQTTVAALLALILMVPLASGVNTPASAQDVITIENGEITIESEDGEKTIYIDAESMEDLISETLDEAMDGMQDVLAELDEMQLEIRLGDDNQLSFETEDQMWSVNMDVIMKEIGSALEVAFDEMDTEDWSDHHHFSDGDFDDEDLAEELDRLKDELHRLKKELDQLKEL
jgi:hypothetical protein